MSRFIKNAVVVPDGVQVSMADGVVTAKGPGGEVSRRLDHRALTVEQTADGLRVAPKKADDDEALALAGTYWRLLDGMVRGAQTGLSKTLELVGVGYRVQVSGNDVVLQLGLSHPVKYPLPAGVRATAPSQTELVLTGADKVLLGQTAANIRRYRPPEPYKGKGIRYAGERIVLKETKKK